MTRHRSLITVHPSMSELSHYPCKGHMESLKKRNKRKINSQRCHSPLRKKTIKTMSCKPNQKDKMHKMHRMHRMHRKHRMRRMHRMHRMHKMHNQLCKTQQLKWYRKTSDQRLKILMLMHLWRKLKCMTNKMRRNESGQASTSLLKSQLHAFYSPQQNNTGHAQYSTQISKIELAMI